MYESIAGALVYVRMQYVALGYVKRCTLTTIAELEWQGSVP